jgi:hypothetical protein
VKTWRWLTVPLFGLGTAFVTWAVLGGYSFVTDGGGPSIEIALLVIEIAGVGGLGLGVWFALRVRRGRMM